MGIVTQGYLEGAPIIPPSLIDIVDPRAATVVA